MFLTIWFEEEASPVPSAPPYITRLFDMLFTWCKFPVVCVDGVDGGELVGGPTVFPVPVLFAGPEDVCFLFLLFYQIVIKKKKIMKYKINWSLPNISIY